MGNQVCEKWLKDRKGRRLDLDDIRTYCRIVTALGRTIELQQQFDLLYPEVERETVVPKPEAGKANAEAFTPRVSGPAILGIYFFPGMPI